MKAVLLFVILSTQLFAGSGDVGNGAGQVKSEFQYIAQQFKYYLMSIDRITRNNLLGDIELEDIIDTIDNVHLVQRSFPDGAVDADGNESPAMLNYSPEASGFQYGKIEIDLKRWNELENKVMHVCHEILGVFGEDRNYSRCAHHFFNKGVDALEQSFGDDFNGCIKTPIYSIKVLNAGIKDNNDSWGTSATLIRLFYQNYSQQIFHGDMPDEKFTPNKQKHPVYLPDETINDGFAYVNVQVAEGRFGRDGYPEVNYSIDNIKNYNRRWSPFYVVQMKLPITEGEHIVFASHNELILEYLVEKEMICKSSAKGYAYSYYMKEVILSRLDAIDIYVNGSGNYESFQKEVTRFLDEVVEIRLVLDLLQGATFYDTLAKRFNSKVRSELSKKQVDGTFLFPDFVKGTGVDVEEYLIQLEK